MTDALLNDLKAALGEAYHIERELTGGGMSRVFVAREQALGREVVIKVLPPELAAGVNRERFRREVQLAARLSHPYIVPLLHAGEAGELLWFTMPFISGESLRHRLEQQGPLPVRDTIVMLHDVVEALAYAHARGVVHRDIKPANILSDGQHAV
ncbi:MAG TPA: serine/threonine-protein kinase, partial [Gemmatimonadales bacterium]|nr:serine/threonine-protein kinase [Gemmatimonadales bacterium]